MKTPRCKGGILTPQPIYAVTECNEVLRGFSMRPPIAPRDRKPADPCPHVACPDDRCDFLDVARLAQLPRARTDAGHMAPTTALLNVGLIGGGALVAEAVHQGYAVAVLMLVAASAAALAVLVRREIRRLEQGQ